MNSMPPAPSRGVFADDGTATIAVALAYVAALLGVAAAILAFRDARLALVAFAAAAIATVALALTSRGRKLFTSSTVWIVESSGGYQVTVELNVRRAPEGPIRVLAGAKELVVERNGVVRRGDTWMVVFALGKEEAPPGRRLPISLRDLRTGRTLARFSALVRQA